MQFQQVQMPDGTPKGRKMWRAADSAGNYAAFYPVGRKGDYYVTWGAASGGAGGERAGCREDAESVARDILRRLAS